MEDKNVLVGKITLKNRKVFYVLAEKVKRITEALVAGKSNAIVTVDMPVKGVFRAEQIADIEETHIPYQELSEEAKRTLRGKPALTAGNEAYKKLPTDTVVLHKNGELWSEFSEKPMSYVLKHTIEPVIFASAHYSINSKGEKEYLLKPGMIPLLLVAEADEDYRPVVLRSWVYGRDQIEGKITLSELFSK